MTQESDRKFEIAHLYHRRLLTQSEVSRYVGVTRESVRRWEVTGELEPVMRTWGGRALFHLEDVRRYKERRESLGR